MEKVSVVIPVYNGERFIKQAIESVLNQKYKNIQIVIINDCSKDKTEDVIFRNFKDLINKKIIYHKNEKNMERVYSRNKGVELSDGEFIFFLDHDDLWTESYVETVIPYLKEYDIVYSFPRTFIDEQGNIIRKSKKSIQSVEKIIFSGLIGYPSASAFRKSSFPFYKQEYLMREDWEIFLRSYISGLKIKVLDGDLILMREHQDRTSRDIGFYKATIKVYSDYKDAVPEKYRADFMFHVGEVCLRYGDIIRGWDLVLRSIFYSPEIIKDKRKVISILKRGFRIDRALRFFNSN
ncbi:glycosyltransferase family 2 protein [Persephonella sp.]|uniref:glycosyltransferase family 2 protein n=1 Tax=Persephonella sp. TaxID=2060922 RepID=UPI00262E7908|nr:glycosyltransferase family 2 protein [Persephonella sp.]